MDDNLTPDQRSLVNEYIEYYGFAGYKKLLDSFGRNRHSDIGNMYGRMRYNALQQVLDKVETFRAMKITGDFSRMENNHRMISNHEGEPERVWTSKDGREIPISRMSDQHLHNTILLIDRNMSKGCHKIGVNEDLADMLDKMEAERIKRGLHLPLVPLKSLAYRKGEIS